MKKYVFIIIVLLFGYLMGYSFSASLDSKLVLADINYMESTKILNNPERGFYRTAIAWFEKNSANHTGYTDAPLVHLRVSMGYYNNVNGENDISSGAIDGLMHILDNYRKMDTSIIIRFSYGDSANKEPSIDQVLKHVEQLKPIFMKYDDVISAIDTGLFGPWGEQHSSTIVTQENINKLVNAFLDNTPDDMQINVRRPSYFAGWAGIDYNDLYKTYEYLNKSAYRVGVYNDGYLGSHSDLGTFLYHPTLGWRVNEVTWLSNHATHTFYGGEVVDNYSSNGIDYTSSSFMIEEMFKTHTTYLNYEWDQRTINRWKSATYLGSDSVYTKESAYTYIANHLGYRYVLRESYLNDYVYVNEANTLRLKGVIENVGAANLINAKKVEVILDNGVNTYSKTIDLDLRDIDSLSKFNYDFTIKMDQDIILGNYDVYLKISNNDIDSVGNNSIEFANIDIWNSTLKANYIGEVVVTNREYYDVNIKEISNGHITLDESKYFISEEVSFTINPDEGYRIVKDSLNILSNGVLVTYKIVGNSYVFSMPSTDVEIEVLFEKIPDEEIIPEDEINPDDELPDEDDSLEEPNVDDSLEEPNVDDSLEEPNIDDLSDESVEVSENNDDNDSKLEIVVTNIVLSIIFLLVLGLVIYLVVKFKKKGI